MTFYVKNCRRCGAQKMTFDVYGVSVVTDAAEFTDLAGNRRYLRRIELACRCKECSRTTVFGFEAYADRADRLPLPVFKDNENLIRQGYVRVFAMPVGPAKPTPADVPEPASRFYEQGSRALADGLYDAAGAMFRKCLEPVTRTDQLIQKVPEAEREKFLRSWLKTRITKLKDLHAIPPALGDLVDVIKDEGDAAVHDDALYDKDSAESLQGFTEAFLE